MEPKVAYWSWALANMAGVMLCALVGIARVRDGRVAEHRRWMLSAAGLVILFLVSYPFKLALLGREELELWDSLSVYVLRVHELCVAVMTLAGTVGITIALRTGLPVEAPDASVAQKIARHRRAGRTAVVSGLLGLLMASWVLWGMYARL